MLVANKILELSYFGYTDSVTESVEDQLRACTLVKK